ncbi:MAG: hypothetical protein P8179_14200 [Candidatus Thiodiazotropha sp.]|jgi:hypothetical protein
MDSISKLTRLLEALRLQQASSGSTGATKAGTTSAVKSSAPQAQNSGEIPTKVDLDQLNRRIGERINRLPPDERQGNKAVQLFIDSVLAWEFGEELLQSESFSRYSRKIQEAIKNDTRLHHEFKVLIELLTRLS